MLFMNSSLGRAIVHTKHLVTSTEAGRTKTMVGLVSLCCGISGIALHNASPMVETCVSAWRQRQVIGFGAWSGLEPVETRSVIPRAGAPRLLWYASGRAETVCPEEGSYSCGTSSRLRAHFPHRLAPRKLVPYLCR